jgi:hypothetical protein
MAASRKRKKIAPPPTTFQFRSRRPSHRARTRVDEHVDHVDHEVDEHVGGGRHQDDVLHHGVVAPQDRRDDQSPDIAVHHGPPHARESSGTAARAAARLCPRRHHIVSILAS